MLVVFDLDGTLALCDHRNHLVHRPEPDWDAFYAACGGDAPNWPVIRVLYAHRRCHHRVEIWTGRREDQRATTLRWLRDNSCGPVLEDMGLEERAGLHAGDAGAHVARLRMRPHGDTRPDVEIKGEWLEEARRADRLPQLAYEDRGRVVAMWRGAGITCLQVAPGDF